MSIILKVCAILNDTTGCLLACAYKRPDCAMGVILGTGITKGIVGTGIIKRIIDVNLCHPLNKDCMPYMSHICAA